MDVGDAVSLGVVSCATPCSSYGVASAMLDVCRLCEQQAELRNSHIIPRFVGRWLRRTSATDYLSRAQLSGGIRRVQDLTTAKLLCADCEEQISSFETYFAGHVFPPWKDARLEAVPQDERIAKFVVSVSLRALWVLWDAGDRLTAAHCNELAQLEQEWRGYVVGRPGFAKGPHSHHLIFPNNELLSQGVAAAPNLLVNHRLTTAFYVYEVFGKTYLTCHMAGLQSISMIDPPEFPVSRGMQVYPEQTLGRERPGVGWGGYFRNLVDFSNDCDVVRSSMTDAQRAMSVSAMEARPARVVASEDYHLLLEQEHLLRVGRPTRSSDR